MISFIVPTTDKDAILKLSNSLDKLGIEFELIPIYHATSFYDCWRKGLKKAKGKYLILTHQDTEYFHIPDLDQYFTKDVGMCGVAGAKELSNNEPWWFSVNKLQKGQLSGQIYHDVADSHAAGIGKGLSVFGEYGEVKLLDGVCLIVKRDNFIIPDADWCKWDYYDHVISMEYVKRGQKLLTIPIVMCHASAGGNKREGFYEAEKRFRKEYL